MAPTLTIVIEGEMAIIEDSAEVLQRVIALLQVVGDEVAPGIAITWGVERWTMTGDAGHGTA